MVEYNVLYQVSYSGETKFAGADESRKRTVILTKAEAEGKNGMSIIDNIKKLLTMYFADANGFSPDIVNVKVFNAVRVSA